MPIDLKPRENRADASAKLEDKVQKHQDDYVKRIMEKQEMKK